MLKQSFLTSFLFCLLISTGAQDSVRFSIADDRGLVKYDKVVIQNADRLKTFFEKLYQLKKSKKGVINIVHIGDSHVQGDYLTNQTRQDFQLEFGNAGRGFLAPHRVAGTTEGYSYFSESPHKWESKRMVFTDQPLPMGLGGVTIRSLEEDATVRIRLKNYPQLDYSFNKATAFMLQEPKAYHIAVQDTLNMNLAFIGSFANSNIVHSATFSLPKSYNVIQFKSMKSMPEQERVTYFGFSFENGKPGVIYHSIGANGAKYKHYLASQYFIEQTQALKPDLIVISLGTNEALDYPYADPMFREQVPQLIQQLQKKNPDAQVLISIPADSYRKKTKRNPGVTKIRKALLELAAALDLPVFDLYEASGGEHSADDWKKASLLRDDGVHFTRAGYELQGDMFYLAMMKSYNQYVSRRRK